MQNNIVLICDDNYAMPTAVTIQSIKKQSSLEAPYSVYVCTFSLSDANKNILENLSVESCRVAVKRLDISLYQHRIAQITQRSHVTPSALIKFELPNIFPDLKRLLYIDSDIIIKEDICDLFDLDITDYYLAASFELWKHLDKLYYNINWNKQTDFYFNSGVMMLNLQLMRKDDISNKLWYYKIHSAKTTLMDQESLNEICGKKTYPLGVKWNFNPVFMKENYINIINKIYSLNYHTLDEMVSDISIIHYVGKTDKPWVYESANMRSYWEQCYKELRWPIVLDLKRIEAQTSTLPFWRIILTNHGLKGLICYTINRLIKRL